MKAVLVNINESEITRRKLLVEGVLDKTRKLVKRKEQVEIPVIGTFNTKDYILVEQEKPVLYIPGKKLPDILDMPESKKKLLPSGWQVLGSIIIVSLNSDLEGWKLDIGKALLSLYPRCCTVLLDRGISGRFRKPQRELIAGCDTETVHKENGCLFKLDAMQVMFSQGNLAEKKRMSKLGRSEIVVDMFAGIGYFSIPMAVHSAPKKILAIEINPIAFGYLKENIKLNRVENIIQPFLGDCMDAAPQRLADRVIMGYLDAKDYIWKGISSVRPGGIIHYHEAVPEALEKRPVERIKAAARERKVEIIGIRRIKKYSPGVRHVVVDARID